MENKPIRLNLVILETRGDRAGHQYYGFRYIRCADGAMVEGRLPGCGCESSIRAGLLQDANGWRTDYFYTTAKITERELNKLPVSPSHPDAMRAWVEKQLP